MKKISLYCTLTVLAFLLIFSGARAQSNDVYVTSVTFPGNYVVGDYVEFLKAVPSNAGASGHYEVSISYTRGNIAAAATFLVSVSHANPDVWREAGRINKGGYVESAVESFAIDVNSQYGNTRFRVRAMATWGVASDIRVDIKVRSVNFTDSWVPLSAKGNTAAPAGLMPMTNEWNLFVGNPYSAASAKVAITANINGDVGIGIRTPQSKLAVAGTITAQKIKVTATGWPDYVFHKDYQLPSLQEVGDYIQTNGHLPEIPAAAVVEKEGQDVGEMNKALLKKVEELTLYLLEENQQRKKLEADMSALKDRQRVLEQQLQALQQK